MKDYISLDIENPNTRGNSLCAIGIIVVKNNKVIDKIYSLINPEDRFDTRNTKINGIDGSMVQDSPTFPEFWHKYSKLITSNVIIGHNITYDLMVISNTLVRYRMKVPIFRYYDTLELARNHIELDSYKLSSIAKIMHQKHNIHNALSDSFVAYKLFATLDKRFGFTEEDASEYSYDYLLRDSVDERLLTNINELVGIIKGIQFDKNINKPEIARLNAWIQENEKYRCFSLFNDIITDLENILEDGIIDRFEYIKLSTIVEQMEYSTIYTKATLDIQVLRGVLDGIISDKQINAQEIIGLKSWLDHNDYLSDVYPYDKVSEIVSSVLADGKITLDEKKQLQQSFMEVLNPNLGEDKNIDIAGKTFCLTGEFESMPKPEVAKKLKTMGGIEKSSVVKNLDYLFVGGLGSDAWKYGKLGAKIVRAQELQEKGVPVQIVSESTLKEQLLK